MRLLTLIHSLLIVGLLSLAVACGQTGDLYLPDDPSTPPADQTSGE